VLTSGGLPAAWAQSTTRHDKPGDFVVVDVAGRGAQAEAESLTVTLPAA